VPASILTTAPGKGAQVSGGGPSAFAPVQYRGGGGGGGAGAFHDSDAARAHMHLYQAAPRL